MEAAFEIGRHWGDGAKYAEVEVYGQPGDSEVWLDVFVRSYLPASAACSTGYVMDTGTARIVVTDASRHSVAAGMQIADEVALPVKAVGGRDMREI